MEMIMGGSCSENNPVVEEFREHQKNTLVKVLWINAVMFVVIACAAFYGGSTTLLSDSVDNLGDALTYGFSLYVVSQSVKAKARVALFKGVLILLGASVVISQVVWKLMYPVVPTYEVMGVFGLAGVAANGVCLWLLWPHRSEDINMSSVFECSGNDMASSTSVLLAAVGVWLFDSGWPDIIVASLLSIVLFKSAVHVIRNAVQEMKK
jgi:Co/Zn/Cd efflux system component